ncbi:hypothetical protein P154DRAFT_518328 [Amniculicola lignicola CBS 123094]|uniref:Uncharacterized protein n=1 Tax=Amniculicola lignicola CBS 123094 TaxID=1392246 RepID=A0A6A5WUR3_9PLEO|nr:hypothetical protein P154DRAFT_518328 [Amniculicola lignicola CBS 123094]
MGKRRRGVKVYEGGSRAGGIKGGMRGLKAGITPCYVVVEVVCWSVMGVGGCLEGWYFSTYLPA